MTPIRRHSSARALCPNADTVDVDLGHSSVFNHPNQVLAKNIGVCPPSPPPEPPRGGAEPRPVVHFAAGARCRVRPDRLAGCSRPRRQKGSLPGGVVGSCDMEFLSHKREWKRSNEATSLSSPATTSPSMMQERERRRTNVPTNSEDATIIATPPTQCTSFLLGLVLVVGASRT
jgi:hypothetical protein